MFLWIISIIICIVTLVKTKGAAEERLSVSNVKGLRIANIVGVVLTGITCVFDIIIAVSAISAINSVSDIPSMGIGGSNTASTSGGTGAIVLALMGDLLISGLIILWHIKNNKKLRIILAKIIQNTVVYCKKCGAAVAKGMRYCTSCGADMNDENPDDLHEGVSV